MKNKETVCAIIVTFNRKELLITCLIALMKQTRQLDAIFIIDNASTDDTPLLLKEKGYIHDIPPKDLVEPWERIFQVPSFSQLSTEKKMTSITNLTFYYIRMHKNTGGAGGFHEGMKRGKEKRFDWLWLMDDDGIPGEDCLKKLLIYSKQFNVICPLVIPDKSDENLSFGLYDYSNKKHIKKTQDIKNFKQRKYLIGTANPFNGTLISRILVQKIGLPKKEMFIWGDETEYMLRAKKKGFKIITVLDARHYHPKQKKEIYPSIIKKLGNVFYVKDKKKLYIYIRNYVYLESRYRKISCIKTSLKYVIFFIIQRKMDINGLSIFLKASFNGLFNRFRLD